MEVGIRRGMNILWRRGRTQRNGRIQSMLIEKVETFLDGDVGGVELFCTHIGIHSVLQLLIAALVKGTKIEPNLRNVRVEPDCAGICIQGVFELANLEVENANGDPKGRITTIAIDGLLISLIRFVVFLGSHICTSEEIPTLSVGRI